MQVDAVSELVFSIADLNDPIEVGTDTTYEVRVANKGSKPATNVLLAAALPKEIKLVSGEGPSRATTRGQQIGFAPIGRINSGEEVIFRIHAQGLRAGTEPPRRALRHGGRDRVRPIVGTGGIRPSC